MDDFKKLTVKYLRELAKKHLVPGHSRLTKDELIAALKKMVPSALKGGEEEAPAPKVAAKKAAPAPKVAAKPARGSASGRKANAIVETETKKPTVKSSEVSGTTVSRTASKPAEVSTKEAAPAKQPEPTRKEASVAPKAAAQPPRAVEEKKGQPYREGAVADTTPPAASARPAQASSAAAAPVAAREVGREESAAARPSEPPRMRRRPAAPSEEPVVEGFFVARMAGEGEAWRHHLTESQGRGQFEADEEGLGDLPASYEDDSTVLLARDPHTLFVFWSFRHETVRVAAEALVSPRAFLRVFEGDTLVREEELQLDSKSFYVHGLPPGRTYRVEAHLVGRDGRSIRLGDPSNPVMLPAVGDSDQTQLRFLRVPPGVPLDQVEELIRSGAVKVSEATGELEVISWERVSLPNSADMVLQRTRRERAENVERLERPEGMEQGDWASSPSGAGWILR